MAKLYSLICLLFLGEVSSLYGTKIFGSYAGALANANTAPVRVSNATAAPRPVDVF